MEDNWLSNEVIKKDFNIGRDGVPLAEQKKIFNELVEEKSYEFQNFRISKLKEESEKILVIIKIRQIYL